MDNQDPRTLQEFVDYVCERDMNEVQFQIGLALIMLRDIEIIYALDAELASEMSLHQDNRYEIYDVYMRRMGMIVSDLLKVGPLFQNMFPTFYTSDLFKLINIHMERCI